jgi:hypothetical protein
MDDQSHIIAQIYAHRQNNFIAAISSDMTVSVANTVVRHARNPVERTSDASSTKISPLTFLRDLFLPPDRAEQIFVDIQDVYETAYERWLKRYGEPLAKTIYFPKHFPKQFPSL